jgi:hypothetical protein
LSYQLITGLITHSLSAGVSLLPGDCLYGHMTQKWLIKKLSGCEKLVAVKNLLYSFFVVQKWPKKNLNCSLLYSI